MTRPWCWAHLRRWPNDTGPHARTEIYGVDAYWKWKPAHAHGGFPFVSWANRGIVSRFEAGADPLAPTLLPLRPARLGFYTQVLWAFARWVAGLRGELSPKHGAFDAEDIFERSTRVRRT